MFRKRAIELLKCLGIFVYFILTAIFIGPILDDAGIPRFFLRDFLLGFVNAVILLLAFELILAGGKKLGWIDQNLSLPWDD